MPHDTSSINALYDEVYKTDIAKSIGRSAMMKATGEGFSDGGIRYMAHAARRDYAQRETSRRILGMKTLPEPKPWHRL